MKFPMLKHISQNPANFPQIIKGETAVFKWLIIPNKKKEKKFKPLSQSLLR